MPKVGVSIWANLFATDFCVQLLERPNALSFTAACRDCQECAMFFLH